MEAKKRPLLTQANAIARLAWARRYEHYTIVDWRRVIWSDETYVVRGKGARPKYTFLSPREQLQFQDILPKQRQGSVRAHFWGGFGYNRRTDLIRLQGDPLSARGGATGRTIEDLYRNVLPALVQPGDIFMHDNASIHKARIVQDALREMGIELMPWPPYSPDLNPIENLWGIVKNELYKRNPELLNMPDNQATLDILLRAAAQAWLAIEWQVLETLATEMKKRVDAVILANGWYTKY